MIEAFTAEYTKMHNSKVQKEVEVEKKRTTPLKPVDAKSLTVALLEMPATVNMELGAVPKPGDGQIPDDKP
jgi:hypothetical protein